MADETEVKPKRSHHKKKVEQSPEPEKTEDMSDEQFMNYEDVGGDSHVVEDVASTIIASNQPPADDPFALNDDEQSFDENDSPVQRSDDRYHEDYEDYESVSSEHPSALVRQGDPYPEWEQKAKDGQADDDMWEELVSEGQRYADVDDETHYRLGKLASLVGKGYGEDRLGKYANRVGKPKKTLADWRQVVNYWGDKMIREFREFPFVRFTHFRCAMRVGRFAEDSKVAYAFMQEAIENEWSVGEAEAQEAQRKGKHSGPKKLAEGTAKVVSVKGKRVTLEIANEALLAAFNTLALEDVEFLLRMFESDLPPKGTTPAEQVEQANVEDAGY